MVDITEQWEHDEQRAMEHEIEKLREANKNLFNALMVAIHGAKRVTSIRQRAFGSTGGELLQRN